MDSCPPIAGQQLDGARAGKVTLLLLPVETPEGGNHLQYKSRELPA